MPYNNLTDRTDAAPLIPEEISKEIITSTTEASATLRMGRRLADMSKKQWRMPVTSLLPTAYFVSPGGTSDTGMKQTTEINWENIFIYAEELAVIVPIPEAVLGDSDFDIWGEVKPALVEAFGAAIDAAIYYGTNKPTNWPSGLVTQANSAGNVKSLASYTDLYDAILSEAGVLAVLETEGYFATGHIAHLSMRSKLRGARDADGNPIFKAAGEAGRKFAYELDGVPCDFPRNGAVASASSLLISGDWSQLAYSIRQDITYKILDQAVITDGSNNIQYNLAQQDMVALRAVLRLGWQLPNPANRIQPTKASRCAFAVLTA